MHGVMSDILQIKKASYLSRIENDPLAKQRVIQCIQKEMRQKGELFNWQCE